MHCGVSSSLRPSTASKVPSRSSLVGAAAGAEAPRTPREGDDDGGADGAAAGGSVTRRIDGFLEDFRRRSAAQRERVPAQWTPPDDVSRQAYYAGLLLAPVELCAEYSFDCIPVLQV